MARGPRMPAVDPKQKYRERSVDNLQRLYTIVAGLSLTTAVAHLVVPDPESRAVVHIAQISINADVLPMFITFVMTIVPFYHGANRYLDHAYVFMDSGVAPRPLVAMLDFGFFFSQALIFYSMGLGITAPTAFYGLYVIILLVDVMWISLVYIAHNAAFNDVRTWLVINTITLAIAFVMLNTPVLPEDVTRWSFLAVLSIARTVLDYGLNWGFYWPGFV